MPCQGHFGSAGIDAQDYLRCVELSEAAGYKGPYTLVFDSEFHANEWDGIAEEREFIDRTLS